MEASIKETVWHEGMLFDMHIAGARGEARGGVGGAVEGNRSCYTMMKMVQYRQPPVCCYVLETHLVLSRSPIGSTVELYCTILWDKIQFMDNITIAQQFMLCLIASELSFITHVSFMSLDRHLCVVRYQACFHSHILERGKHTCGISHTVEGTFKVVFQRESV